MDGRWTTLLGFGLLVATIGCNKQQTMQQPTVEQSMLGQEKPSMFSGLFAQAPPGPMKQPSDMLPPVKDTDPKGLKLSLAMAQVHANAATMEGRSAIERDQFIDSARQKYQHVLAEEPDNTEALVGLAKLYAQTSSQELAVQTMQMAINQYPANHALAYELAGMQVRFRDYSGAEQSIQHALQHDPENRTYQKTLGYVQAQTGRWEDSFATLMKLMPEANARYFVGRVMIDKQMVDEGMNQIRTASNLAPDYEPAKIVLADYQAGNVTGQVTNAQFSE